jgi:hypothetical protein
MPCQDQSFERFHFAVVTIHKSTPTAEQAQLPIMTDGLNAGAWSIASMINPIVKQAMPSMPSNKTQPAWRIATRR